MQAKLPTLRRRFTLLGTSTLLAMLELLAFFPVVLLLHVYVLNNALWISAAQLIGLYIIGFFGGASKLLTRTIYELLYALVFGAAIAFWLQGSFWQGWVSTLIGVFIMMRGIRMMRVPWVYLFPTTAYIAGLISYFVSVPIMSRFESFQPYMGLSHGLGFASLIIFFFYLNRLQLAGATLSNSQTAFASLSTSVRRMNRVWIVVILCIIAGVGFFVQIKQFVYQLLRSIVMFIIGLFPESKPAEEPAPQPSAAAPQGMPPLEKGEPSWLALLLEKVVFFIGYALIAALLILAIYLLFKKLIPVIRQAIRRLLQRLQLGGSPESSQGYSDEQEQLVEWKELPSAWLKELSNRFTRKGSTHERWSQLTSNRERVRYLYRGLAKQAADKGHPYHTAHTPDENGQAWLQKELLPSTPTRSIISLYNGVRYGDEAVTDQDLKKAVAEADSLFKERLK